MKGSNYSMQHLPQGLRRRRQLVRILAFIAVAFFVFEFLYWRRSEPRTEDVPLHNSHSNLEKKPIGRVFIAANLWKCEELLEDHWIPGLFSLILLLGKENVFVSITASPGPDRTLTILGTLEKQLEDMGVENRIVLGGQTHKDVVNRKPEPGEAGWVVTPRGRTALRRIPYLAKVRNEVLEPLEDPKVVNGTRSFDKILFLNDIVFTGEDAWELLRTRNGHYSAACGLDFTEYRRFYDTFVMRDTNGWEFASTRFPIFASGPSRDAMLRGEIVPVKSCWNGIAAFDAKPFLPPTSLRFRAIDDSMAAYHLEGSECCLIHVDNPETEKQGVWVNPRVRVAYEKVAYDRVRVWPTREDEVVGWFVRFGTNLLRLPWLKGAIKRKIAKWEKEGQRKEPGSFCVVEEMQVLSKTGWTKIGV
ncbi:hypothetical protein CC1G_11053 [Coprinopsis cinerea okayama7|uniref:Polysaccharide export protein n=1 Tax=Coprinopsis cinerea (strain Okayama-7 / 130 / ATCC MYA-4618 / FGSC 9003) TaxID=240176 RepID=A8NC84_COPC7|nr:hypothetical protein CC1G_11053 [Coprinopsis cinerea okayama7\|eukprot:XP_001832428.1 hypothetical protein CC1G_11053 [Coprinopsis cinerea okayama7\